MSERSEVRLFELPEELEQEQRRAVWLERLTLAYMASAIVLLFLVLGQSQAMKAAWIEDLLSLLAPAAFLVAARIRRRPANEKFPWGYHRAFSIAYLFAALALLVMGAYVFGDSALKLVMAEHPPIGVIQLFGEEVWLGWLMIGALLYSGIPPIFLGRAKLKLADELHDKVLYADAEMNKADWMTAGAAIVGVLGIGIGLWWADAVAALFISLDILRDGWRNVRAATHDMMDARPRRHDASEWHPLVDRMERELAKVDWIEKSAVRIREEGHVFTGEALVVPKTEDRLVARLDEVARRLLELDWKLYDLVVVPVPRIDIPSPGGPTELGPGGERRHEGPHDESLSGSR